MRLHRLLLLAASLLISPSFGWAQNSSTTVPGVTTLTTEFFCSTDGTALEMTSGTQTTIIEANMVTWNANNVPTPGCSAQNVADITRTGFYCDYHYLTDYKGNRQIYADNATCENVVAQKPTVVWN